MQQEHAPVVVLECTLTVYHVALGSEGGVVVVVVLVMLLIMVLMVFIMLGLVVVVGVGGDGQCL